MVPGLVQAPDMRRVVYNAIAMLAGEVEPRRHCRMCVLQFLARKMSQYDEKFAREFRATLH